MAHVVKPGEDNKDLQLFYGYEVSKIFKVCYHVISNLQFALGILPY